MFQFPEPVLRIAQAMSNSGGNALVVGGSVRDMFLGLPPKDFDLEVYGIEPGRLESIIRSLGPDRVDTVGIAFGVVMSRFGEWDIDISIPRRDSKTGSGHRGFTVTGDPHLDPQVAAQRRDFTMNALMMDPFTGEVFDFFGGRDDLERGVIRAIDSVRFGDDPLRPLRAVQFAARFDFGIDEDTMRICRLMIEDPEFGELPSWRIGEEWRKLLLKSDQPSRGLDAGHMMGMWRVLHPELHALVGVQQDPSWHPEGDVWTHTAMAVDVAARIVRREGLTGDDALVIIAGALCHDFGKPMSTEFVSGRWHAYGHHAGGVAPTQQFLARMEFGHDVEQRVMPLVANHMFLALHSGGEMSDTAIRRLARRLAPATVRELVLVMEADVLGRGGDPRPGRLQLHTQLRERAESLEVLDEEPLPILMGCHLIEHLGWKPGPRFGEVLRAVYEEQIAGRVTDLDSALEAAQKVTTA